MIYFLILRNVTLKHMPEISLKKISLYKREDKLYMALGFTSHFAKSEQPFGSLILGNAESETAGSVASNDVPCSGLLQGGDGDCCEFSVSVNIDYSQYANYTCSSGSTETAGSVAMGGCGSSTVSSYSGGSCGSYSGGGGGCSASFTC